MSVAKRGRFFHYDFYFKGRRYQGTTDQASYDAAVLVEAKVRERLRLDRWDLAVVDRLQTPSFTAWAEQYLKHQRTAISRPDLVERTLRMVLGFWGRKPPRRPTKTGVYHDLRLLDPISDPEWIVKFDAWMTRAKLSGSTKNSYRSALSGMYELALRPQWRKLTRIKENPFRHLDRDPTVKRDTTLSIASLHALLEHADPHVRLALAIGALAPKLRLAQVLGLRYDRHLDRELTVIRFAQHKTMRHVGLQVTAVSSPLQAILKAARRTKRQTHVVTYKGRPVLSIKKALKSAAKAAGLVYGMRPGAVTFHSLRHAMATELARLGTVSRVLHASTMGHTDPRTTEQFYTHLSAEDQRPVLEQLAAKVDVARVLLTPAGTFVGTAFRTRGKDQQKRRRRRRRSGTDNSSN